MIMTQPTPPDAPATDQTSTDADYAAFQAAFLAWKASGQPSATPVESTPTPPPVSPPVIATPEPAPEPLTFSEVASEARDVLHALVDRARYASENEVRKAKAAIDKWLAS